MPHEVSDAALLTGLWTPLVVAIITAAASTVIALMNTRADDLKRAERLTLVLRDMDVSPERDIVASLRDDYAVNWTLRQVAPGSHVLRIVISLMTAAGAIALTGAILVGLYVGLGYGTVSDWFFWVYYSIGLLLLIGAGWLREVAARRRRAWIREERERRSLREPLHEDLLREAKPRTRRSG